MTRLQSRISRRIQSHEAGFTLIELLVVIIILGILAAVVVFAVGGVGDKGKAASVSTDAKTIRTAQEAYCAQNGKYATGAELIAGGFLSDLPVYHAVGAQNTGFGSCNGWSFSILQSAQAGAQPGKWEAAASPPGNTLDLIRMSDGRVVNLQYSFPTTSIAVWDPLDGQWTPKEPPPFGPGSAANDANKAIELTDDAATPVNDCGANCGKILFHFGHCGSVAGACSPWYFFDPDEAPLQQWVNLPIPASFESRGAIFTQSYVQMHDNPATTAVECGANCGKVLIMALEGDAPDNFEVFDPKDSTFTELSYIDRGASPSSASLGVRRQLADGRVLLVGEENFLPAARTFDPVTLTFSPPFSGSGVPAQYHYGSGDPEAPILPNGEMFFGEPLAFDPSVSWAEVYSPVPGGTGTWRPVAPCEEPDPISGVIYCTVLGPLPDGRVLGFSSLDNRSNTSAATGRVYIYDENSWVRTSDFLNPRMTDGVLLDPRTGPCGEYCNKMLVGGDQVAALYSP